MLFSVSTLPFVHVMRVKFSLSQKKYVFCIFREIVLSITVIQCSCFLKGCVHIKAETLLVDMFQGNMFRLNMFFTAKFVQIRCRFQTRILQGCELLVLQCDPVRL